MSPPRWTGAGIPLVGRFFSKMGSQMVHKPAPSFLNEIAGHQEIYRFCTKNVRSADCRVGFTVAIRAPAARKFTLPAENSLLSVRLCDGRQTPDANFQQPFCAKTVGERVVRELANGSKAATLNALQARAALAALQCLESFRQSKKHRLKGSGEILTAL